MPVARYFFFVGLALLALLFGVDAYLPKSPANDSTNVADANAATYLSAIRIRSDRKWPERVEFDTSQPTINPAPVRVAATDVPTAPDTAAPVRTRDAFAQLQTSEPKKPAVKLPPKRKIARNRAGPPTILVAQQPRLGFFGNTIW
jgi:hypothetical protein